MGNPQHSPSMGLSLARAADRKRDAEEEATRELIRSLRLRLSSIQGFLRCVEVHQEINWSSDSLKDAFYQAMILCNEDE